MKEEVFTNASFCVDLASTKFYDYNADGNVTRITTALPPSGGGSSSAMSSGGPSVQSTSGLSSGGAAAQAAPGSGGGSQAASAPSYCATGFTEHSAIRFGYANNGRAVTFVHDERWCVKNTCNGTHSCTAKNGDCTNNYSITWAKEFRYDGARARYLVRNQGRPESYAPRYAHRQHNHHQFGMESAYRRRAPSEVLQDLRRRMNAGK